MLDGFVHKTTSSYTFVAVMMAFALLSACESDLSDDSELAEEIVDVDDSPYTDAEVQFDAGVSIPPGTGALAEIRFNEDHSLWFFADESGVGMTELSYSGYAYTALPQFRDSTPAEMFWALSERGVAVPEALVAHHEAKASRNKVLPFSEVLEDQPQGWGHHELDLVSSPSKAVVCDNFAANHCPYSLGYCGVDEGGPTRWHNMDEVDEYYAAVCVDVGTVTDALMYKKQGAVTCAYEANWQVLWNTNVSSGGILTHSWTTGDPAPYGFRLYDHALSNGFLDTYNWSSRYLLGSCG